jgi:hypothetical protein
MNGCSSRAKIEDGLERSRLLVLCMSAQAFGSDWAQLESGTSKRRGNLPFRNPLNKERRFLPLRLDDNDQPTDGNGLTLNGTPHQPRLRHQSSLHRGEATGLCRLSAGEVVERDLWLAVMTSERHSQTPRQPFTRVYLPISHCHPPSTCA